MVHEWYSLTRILETRSSAIVPSVIMFAWVLALLLVAAGAVYMYYQQQQELEAARKREEAKQQQLEQQAKPKKSKPKKVDVTAELKRKKQVSAQAQAEQDAASTHPSVLHVLRGHKYALTAAAFSPNGRFVATASSDRTIRVYQCETLGDKTPKFQKLSLDFDHATAMTFSCDGRTLVVATQGGNVRLYQKLKNKPEVVAEFPVSHKTDVHSVLMNDVGQAATIVTSAEGSDTEVKFWSIQGDLLQTVNTNQVANYHCVGSKDNRYIAVAAYTPEVRILEISREKTGAFKKTQKIMSLRGHRTGILDLAFDGNDSLPVNHIVTTSKDGSVRLWNINVRYMANEDPKLVRTFTQEEKPSSQSIDLSPNGKVLVMTRGKDIVFYSTEDGWDPLEVIPSALPSDIQRIYFSPDGTQVLALGKNAKHTTIFQAPN